MPGPALCRRFGDKAAAGILARERVRGNAAPAENRLPDAEHDGLTSPGGYCTASAASARQRGLAPPVPRQNPDLVETVYFPCLGARHYSAMMLTILRLLSLILTTLRLRSKLALENLALRQQFAVLNGQHRRPKLRKLDRFFWLLLSRSWERWKKTLIIVKLETVLRWHRRRFASYWTRLSRQDGPGRPGKDCEIRELIRKMAKSNPLWGTPRVHGEL